MRKNPSLLFCYQSIPVPKHWSWWSKMFVFAGPGISYSCRIYGSWKLGYRLAVRIPIWLYPSSRYPSFKYDGHLVTSFTGNVRGCQRFVLAQASGDHYSYPVSWNFGCYAKISLIVPVTLSVAEEKFSNSIKLVVWYPVDMGRLPYCIRCAFDHVFPTFGIPLYRGNV